MNVDPRAAAWARLQLSDIAPRPLVELLRAFETPEGVLAATPAERRRWVPADAAARLDSPPDAARLDATLA